MQQNAGAWTGVKNRWKVWVADACGVPFGTQRAEDLLEETQLKLGGANKRQCDTCLELEPPGAGVGCLKMVQPQWAPSKKPQRNNNLQRKQIDLPKQIVLPHPRPPSEPQ